MKRVSLLLISLLSFSIANTQPLSGSEFLINSTVRIDCDLIVNGVKYKGTGTGFFFTYHIGSREIPVIVTNKHVVKNSSKGTLSFKNWDISNHPIYGSNEKLEIANFEKLWIGHPDSSVDIAVFPLTPLAESYYRKYGKTLLYTTFSERNILNDSIANTLNAIEDLYMIGYPYGLKDDTNNIPIVRRGISATPIYLDYNSKKEFLVDMPVYKGSSGSPLVIFDEISTPRYGRPQLINRMVLLGINYATYTSDYEGKLIPKKTDNIIDSIGVKTTLPLYNIGIIIKAERLLDFKKVFTELLKK